MKVMDLKCTQGHVFEGWFASEADFVAQCEKSLLQCPLCGDPSVVKKLSAPRLLLSGTRADPPEEQVAAPKAQAPHPESDNAKATQMWMALARQVVAHTTDVGESFAEEARKIHYGEKEERGIRGTATPEERQSLAEEGIDVMSFPMPLAVKEQLQ